MTINKSSRPSADVVIIGGGIAGMCLAAHLGEHVDVIVLEKERELAMHSTGRSAATFIETYGSMTYRRLTVASRSELEPYLSPRPVLQVGTDAQSAEIEAAFAQGHEAGASVELVDRSVILSLCPGVRSEAITRGVVDRGTADIDVHGLHQHYVKRHRELGGRTMLRTEALELERAGESWRIGSGEIDLDASIVVNAAGAWGDVVAERAGLSPIGLEPRSRTAFTVPAPATHDVADWPLVVDVEEGWYFRPEGPQLLCSLADERLVPPHDVRPREIDIALAIDRINVAADLGIRTVRSSWAGLRTFAPDREAVIGCHQDDDRFFWYVGQGGYGIQSCAGSAKYAAARLLNHSVDSSLADIEPVVSPLRFAAG